MPASIEHSPQGLTIRGELNAHSVPQLLHDVRGFFNQGRTITIELGDVERADSAGVALLLDWLRSARAAGSNIRYRNPPRQMQAIIRFCALEQFLPIDETRGN